MTSCNHNVTMIP